MSSRKPQTWTYRAIVAQQSAKHTALMIAAPAREVLAWARIECVERGGEGVPRGFQRPQIASHVRQIRDYLAQPDAVLLSPIVVAFVGGVKIVDKGDGMATISMSPDLSGRGFVVDGQQRLSSLCELPNKNVEVIVSVLVCTDYAELRRQFILINNTRPLSKALIQELLPGVGHLPPRLAARADAACLTQRLNYDETSSLRGQICQHTHPTGVIKDTAIQKVIMSSAADGVLRELRGWDDAAERSFRLMSDFYGAVQDVFAEDWNGHTAKTSRLVHGTGIVALGFVMEWLYVREGARNRAAFGKGLSVLKGRTAWTNGSWKLGDEVVPWNGLQNVQRHIMALAQHLLTIVKRSASSKDA